MSASAGRGRGRAGTGWARWGVVVLVAALVIAVAPVVGRGASRASAATLVTQQLSFRTSDGTVLHAAVAGNQSLDSRPIIVEDSPYAPDVSSLSWAGPEFNVVELQWRGTGDSTGTLDTTGTQDQSDLSQFLGWACRQPWSNGRIGLYGFSASAIVVYNSMHLPLPCVKTAALMAGSTDLYRDLFYIGGIFNMAAGVAVEAAVGEATLQAGPARLQSEPSSVPATALGYPEASVEFLANQTETAFWKERSFKGDHDRIPILADTSFYDVEPAGPFAAFNATKAYGSHLLVYGAHDGFPAGLPGPFPQYRNWFDHYLIGTPLSAANQPTVSTYLGNGNRQAFLNGDVTHITGSSWPLAGTSWDSLYLSADPSDSAGAQGSGNDGSLANRPAAGRTDQTYLFAPSDFTETDLHNTSVLDTYMDQLAGVLPGINDMQFSALDSLSYTSPPLAEPLTVEGPGAVDLYASSLEPYTDLYVVVADVWPDGHAYPIATGALRTSYPAIDRSRSLVDASGDVVDPYNDYVQPQPTRPGQTRRYQVELLPMGNRFAAGSRIRLYVVGTPIDQVGALPGPDTISLGGPTPSRLLLPTVGSLPAFTH